MRKINLIIMMMIIISCKSASLPTAPKTLSTLVAERLGENATVQKNKDATFALGTKENTSSLSVSYIIVKLNDLTIVEEGNTARASFVWINTYKIEIREIPGLVKKEQEKIQGKIIDVTKYITKL
jgi:hypothetical protein